MEMYEPSSLPCRESNAMSPIFDFDRAWVDSIKSIRHASKHVTVAASESQLANLEAAGALAPPPPTYSKLPPSTTTMQPTYLFSTWPPLPTRECIPVYEDAWPTTGNQREYSSISPRDVMSLSNPSASSFASSTHSPMSLSSGRGSKRSSAEIDTECSSLEFTASKRQRTSHAPSQKIDEGCIGSRAIAVDAAVATGSWEILQGPVVLAEAPPQHAPILRVREMPALREPAPRMPKVVWDRLRFSL